MEQFSDLRGTDEKALKESYLSRCHFLNQGLTETVDGVGGSAMKAENVCAAKI